MKQSNELKDLLSHRCFWYMGLTVVISLRSLFRLV